MAAGQQQDVVLAQCAAQQGQIPEIAVVVALAVIRCQKVGVRLGTFDQRLGKSQGIVVDAAGVGVFDEPVVNFVLAHTAVIVDLVMRHDVVAQETQGLLPTAVQHVDQGFPTILELWVVAVGGPHE